MSKQLDPLGTTAPELLSIDQYRKYYSNREYLKEEWWLKKCLPFSDNMPALSYAHGISWSELITAFPQVFSKKNFYDSIRGIDWPDFERFQKQDFFTDYPADICDEIMNKDKWNLVEEINNDLLWIGKTHRHSYSVHDQIDFINHRKKRQPKKILEIGGGTGALANTIKYLGIQCISVDIAEDQQSVYNATNNHYFGISHSDVDMRSNCISVEIKNINLGAIDTVIMVESIEHIPEQRFNIFWEEIVKKFRGRFIVTNWLDYHPIMESGPEHCRKTDDQFYDFLSTCALSCWHRDRSHLVLEF